MKIVSILVLQLCYVIQLLADTPSRALPYVLKSSNGRFALSAVPYQLYGACGSTYVIKCSSQDTLYSFDKYIPLSLIDNTGNYVVVVSAGAPKVPMEDITAFEIYFKGELKYSYSLADLTTDSTKYFLSVTHIGWYFDSKVDGRIFTIRLQDRSQHEFDLKTGDMKSSQVFAIHDSKRLPRLNITYNDSIIYPNPYELPTVEPRTGFFEAFNKMGQARIFRYDDPARDSVATKSFLCAVMVYRDGNGKMMNDTLDIAMDVKYLFLDDLEMQRKISDFIDDQIFDTSGIPDEIPMWLYTVWLYVEVRE